MIYTLAKKDNLLSYVFGDIDWIDIVYAVNNDKGTSYNTLLLCLNESMLSILYKYDQDRADYVEDWTDTGTAVCEESTYEIISDDLLKLNVTQKFVRSFAFYKEVLNSEIQTSYNTNDFISLYPSIFLDFENSQNILTNEEKQLLLNSKLLHLTFYDDNENDFWIPSVNENSSRSIVLPNHIKAFTVTDNKINYNTKDYSLSHNSTDYTVSMPYDQNVGYDKYSKYSKCFNVINDSTVIMDFTFFIDLGKMSYMIDSNDININYRINVTSDNVIKLSTSYDLAIYENFNTDYFSADSLVYIKDAVNDNVIALAKILNNANNKLTLDNLWYKYGFDTTAIEMDKFVINKIKNLENFTETRTKSNFIDKLRNENLFSVISMEFTEDDFKAINRLS